MKKIFFSTLVILSSCFGKTEPTIIFNKDVLSIETDKTYFIKRVEITNDFGISGLNSLIIYELGNFNKGSNKLNLNNVKDGYKIIGKYTETIKNEQLYFDVSIVNKLDTSQTFSYSWGVNRADTTQEIKIWPNRLAP